MEAFYAVLPVFLLIAVGAAVHMTDVLPENTGAAMGLYVLKLALPVLMLHILSGASRLDLAHGGFWLGVIGAQMLCYLLGYAVDRLFPGGGRARPSSPAWPAAPATRPSWACPSWPACCRAITKPWWWPGWRP